MLYPLALLVLTTTLLCEVAARRAWLPYWVSRKVLHVVAVGSCAVAALYVPTTTLLPVVAVAWLLLLPVVGRGGLLRDESGRPAWGILWFPLAFLLLLVVCPGYPAAFGMAVLAICDPAATVAGRLVGGRGYTLTGDPKTLTGSLACYLSLLLLLVGWPDSTAREPAFWLLAGVFIAACEGLGSGGRDNLYVPLAAAWFYVLATAAPAGVELDLLVLLVAGGAFAYLSVSRDSLTLGGAVAAVLLGTAVVLGPGWRWLIPLLFFFASSSLLGRWFPARSAASDGKQDRARDAAQVACNGAIFALVALLSPLLVRWPELLLVAAGVATADTWSSQLGQYFRGATWDILRLRPVPAGLSGGVSVVGSLGGAAGAVCVAGLGVFLLPDASPERWAILAGAGFGGMLLDSVLGSLLQATYHASPRGELTDQRGAELVSGLPWMTNDLVNLLAIAGTVSAYALLS